MSIIGLYGAYLVSRFFGAGLVPAIIASFVFMFNSMFSLSITEGMLNFLTVSYIPWVFYFYLKSFSDLRFCLLSGVFSVLIFFGGGVHVLIITFTFLAIYSVVSIILRKSSIIRTGKVIGLLLLITFSIGAIKIIPSLEFTNQYPRIVDDYSGYSLSSLCHSAFSTDQRYNSARHFSDEKGFLYGMSWYMDDNGMYIGLISFVLFLIGFIFAFKKRLSLALALLVLIWLCFGDRISPSIWGFLRQLPVYKLQRVATRYRFPLVLCLAIFVGLGVQFIKDYLFEKSIPKTINRAIMGTILIVVFLNFVMINIPVWEECFTTSPPAIPEKKIFFQKCQGSEYKSQDDSGSLPKLDGPSYFNFLMNAGTIDVVEPVPIPARAIPVNSEEYNGEVFFSGQRGRATLEAWSPNRIVINVEAEEDGYVIINQNYFPGWKVEGEDLLKIESIRGLLGVKVPRGNKTIAIYYLPASFQIGLLVSVVTLLLILFWLGIYYFRNRPRISESTASSPSKSRIDNSG